MISLACSTCSTTLNVDDGFAGGVCRCSKCGTVQTVPRKGESMSAANCQVIYERKSRDIAPQDLHSLGDAVARPRRADASTAERGVATRFMSRWIGIALVGVAVIAIAAFFLFRDSLS